MCNNQLVFYDNVTNHWHWPTTYGKIPSPRSGPAAFVTEDPYSKSNSPGSYVIVFGGRGCSGFQHDLLTLNLANMNWGKVSATGSARGADAGLWPEARFKPTLTRISNKIAVLYGGKVSGSSSGDCWMLNIEAAISQLNPENIWTRCLHHEGDKRSFHAAVMEPSSGRLWIVGGIAGWENLQKSTIPIRELTFSSNQRLKVLALESVARNAEKIQEGIKELPKDLQKAIATKAEKHVVT